MTMNRRRILLILAAVVAIVVLLLLRPKSKPAESPPETSSQSVPSSPVAVSNSARQTTTASGNSASAGSGGLTKADQVKTGLAALNDEDIVLYGKVIDQFGAPVADAVINGSIQVNNGTRVGADTVSTKSDASGLFTISGYKGKALGINVSKDGYVMAAVNTRFVYSLLWSPSERYYPDINNPAVMKLWKLQGSEPLVQIDLHSKIPVTSDAVRIDLARGQIVPTGGDLKITINRSPGLISGLNRLDWGVQVEAVDGGIIDTTVAESRVTFQAPDSGYKPSETFMLSTNAPYKWFETFDQAFFVKSQNGKVFSKMSFSFRINEEPDMPASIGIRGVANVKGSRNWEATAQQ